MLPNLGYAKVLLIDDDPVFGEIVQSQAFDVGIDLTYYPSLVEMGSFAKLGQYNMILLDVHLGMLHGTEIAEYVEIFFQGTPVILVSADESCTTERTRWPSCVRGFVSKHDGTEHLLNQAFNILKRDHFLPYEKSAETSTL